MPTEGRHRRTILVGLFSLLFTLCSAIAIAISLANTQNPILTILGFLFAIIGLGLATLAVLMVIR